MPDEDFPGLGPEEFPLPFGVDADSGAPLPSHFPDLLELDAQSVAARGEPGAADHLAISDIDPNNLGEAGWCVIYAAGTPPEVKQALAPLLDRRQGQAGRLFRVFDESSAVKPGDLAQSWVEKHGASFRMVDPELGVPLYVLLVGNPENIPFTFQYLLDLYWNVGRLDFDAPEDYRAYAEKVVAYESAPAAALPTRKKAALFCARNPGDRATGLLHNQVAKPLLEGGPSLRTLQGVKDFAVQPLLAKDASKQNLLRLLRGGDAGGRPALLFTGSHGIRVKDDEARAREENGALLCQDWPGYGETKPEHLLRGADITPDFDLSGMIHYLFACYGGACPAEDDFDRGPDGKPLRLLQKPVLSRLPQRLLRQGALAVLGHVDRAWTYSFQSGRSVPQVQEMRDVMVRLLKGERIGEAVDGFNKRWAVLAAELQETQALLETGFTTLSPAAMANRWVARNDARNYIILGDPAVRLRSDDLLTVNG